MHPRLSLLALGITLGLAAGAHASTTEQPKLTAQTRNSGGAMPAEQARLHFDHAELHFAIDPARRHLDGEATLRFTAREPTDVLLLDLDRNLPIRSVAVDGKPLARDAWSNPDGRLRIRLAQPLGKDDSVSTTIVYGGKPHVAKRAPWDGGFVWSHTKDGQPWVASAVEGEGCDLFWPCIDQPTGEPDLVDTYVTVPKALAAPGNGVLVEIRDNGATRTWHWRIKQPDTYAITLNVGPFEELRGDYKSRYGNTIPMELWYLRGHEADARALFAEFPRMLDFFEQQIGPYPFGDEKMGVVETPHLGMEHQTLNAYGNGYPKSAYGFDWLLQHEFAHEWFGNQVTNRNWDDMWLHEGFGTYMQPLYGQYLHGDMPYFSMLHEERMKLSNTSPIVSGQPRTEEEVYDGKTGPGLDIYYKGSLVLHTLRELIGDDAFFESVRRLVYGRPDPEPGNFRPRYATTKEYIGIVDQVTGKDLKWFFDVYLYDAKLPRLETNRRGDMLQFRWVTAHGEPFPMPLDVQVGDTVHTLAMAGGTGELKVPEGSLMIVDPRSKVLREMPHVEAFQAWEKAQKADKKAKEKAAQKN
ncbi:M1 family metallopeptidase [Frateuria soli]|uniref:M1 family metallopeptidase n=1 Tax=Frateuria soli TaxID=1542730 RepID=UPI001E4A4561|nr:M1 family metallopeptidase [Frateuria soli]UGB37706.1 M1 family metallopeptidase [Frateuria soli]